MFKNDLLESLSKVKYYVPLIVYIPVIGVLFYKSFWEVDMSLISFIGWFLSGLAIWTITEYILHRYVFHFEPDAEWGKKFISFFMAYTTIIPTMPTGW